MPLDHPSLLDRLTSQLQEKYLSSDQDARKMASDILIKRGHLSSDGELTEDGKERQFLGAEGRAMDRASKRVKGDLDPSQWMYDPETNIVRKRGRNAKQSKL